MASPQTENGYTKISNELLEALCRFRIPGESRQIFDVILRKTYGFKKKSDKISMDQFSKATGLKRQNCLRAIRKLEEMNLISIVRDRYVNVYSIQKDFEKWKALPKRNNKKSVIKNDDSYTNATVIKNDDKLSSKMIPAVIKNDDKTVIKNDSHKRKKENIQKKHLKKSVSGSKEPDFIDQIISLFKDLYLETRGLEYLSNGKDRSAVGKLLKLYKSKNEDSSEETLIKFKFFFEKCLSIPEKYYWQNMSLPLIASKINEIRTIIKEKHGSDWAESKAAKSYKSLIGA